MTAKQTANMAEAMEKLGYEIIGIKEREEDIVFPKTVEIKLKPIIKSED